MTNEIVTAPAPVVSPVKSETKAEELQRKIQSRRDEILKAAEERAAKEIAKLQAELTQVTIGEHLGEIVTNVHDFLVGLFSQTLDIEIPASGVTFDWHIDVKPASDGSAMVSVTNIEGKKASGVTGTRRPRGTGTDPRWAFNGDNVEGFEGVYQLPDGSETKSAAKVLNAFDYKNAGDSAPRLLPKFVEDRGEAVANTVKAKIAGEWVGLADAVTLYAPAKAETTETTETEATVASTPAN